MLVFDMLTVLENAFEQLEITKRTAYSMVTRCVFSTAVVEENPLVRVFTIDIGYNILEDLPGLPLDMSLGYLLKDIKLSTNNGSVAAGGGMVPISTADCNAMQGLVDSLSNPSCFLPHAYQLPPPASPRPQPRALGRTRTHTAGERQCHIHVIDGLPASGVHLRWRCHRGGFCCRVDKPPLLHRRKQWNNNASSDVIDIDHAVPNHHHAGDVIDNAATPWENDDSNAHHDSNPYHNSTSGECIRKAKRHFIACRKRQFWRRQWWLWMGWWIGILGSSSKHQGADAKRIQSLLHDAGKTFACVMEKKYSLVTSYRKCRDFR
jgi:hypothetical protein